MKWIEVTEARYNEMLEILPPIGWVSHGFLVGEPWTHRECTITKQVRAAYSPFITWRGKFYEGDEPLTIPEFRAVDPASVAQ